MNLKNFFAGLTVLVKYSNNPDGYHIGAEHDQFFAYATDKPLEPDDVAKMREFGWFQTIVKQAKDLNPPLSPAVLWHWAYRNVLLPEERSALHTGKGTDIHHYHTLLALPCTYQCIRTSSSVTPRRCRPCL